MGNEGDQGYRGALDAAYARIAELERELATARAQLAATPAQQSRVAQLAIEHAAAHRAYVAAVARRTQIVRRTIAAGAIATLFFTALIASLGPSGHPLNACLLGVAVSVVVASVVGQLTSGEPLRLGREVAMLARDLDVLTAQSIGVRVEGRTGLLNDASNAEPDATALAERGRNTRRTL